MFQSTVTLYSQQSFRIVLLQLDLQYYLGVRQQFPTSNITTSISPAQRCLSIEELFDAELSSVPRIRRVKSYNLPCQRHAQLQCFVDRFYLCLCTIDHRSNCFLFDQKKSFTCDDNVYCQNGYTCLHDRPTCLLSILCVCQDCFFGDRCQF